MIRVIAKESGKVYYASTEALGLAALTVDLWNSGRFPNDGLVYGRDYWIKGACSECGRVHETGNFVVVCIGPKNWYAVRDYEGVEKDYRDRSGNFSCKRAAEERAEELSS